MSYQKGVDINGGTVKFVKMANRLNERRIAKWRA